MSREFVTLPLHQLQHSPLNVRKTQRGQEIEELAASIASKGVLENLIVRKRAKGADRSYEVIAGGRRLAALKLLSKRKKIARDYPVPCRVVRTASTADVIEIGLAENTVRVPMHPADQFDAFARLQAEGLSADEIAARFGIRTAIVLQRLKLAAVSPRVIAEYRGGAMTLEQLMAFAISDDRDAQEAWWFENAIADHSPEGIRRHLTRTHVDSSDRRARFIGAQAYKDAGGEILRDLFQPEDEGYFTDSQLLDRLVAHRLTHEADAIKAEGWSWIEIHPAPDYACLPRFSRIAPAEVRLPKKDERRIKTLSRRYDDLVAEVDDGDSAMHAELDQISEELDVLRARKEIWSAEQKATSGVVIGIEYDGSLHVTRGLVMRPEDRGRSDIERPVNGKVSEGHSESLLLELSAERTAALREVLASRPQQAMTALLALLVGEVFAQGSTSCLQVSLVVTDLGRASKRIGEAPASKKLHERHIEWQQKLPLAEGLWDWLEEATPATRIDLLAYCVAMSVNALHRSGDSSSADTLARTIGLDMQDWWAATCEGYFRHLTKDQIKQAVAEARSPVEAQRLDGLKKAEMSQIAETLLRGAGWLPSPLKLGAGSETATTI